MHIADQTPRESLYYNYRVYPFKTPPELAGEKVKHPVVIVGAGPVGLAMAVDLARYDVPVVVLEAAVQVSEGSRAIVFTQRSMEILQQVGVADRMMEKALPWYAGNSFYRDKQVFRMEAPLDENSRYAPMNNLQQQYLEEYLVDKAIADPLIDLRWGSKVVAIMQNDKEAIIKVDTEQGEYNLHTDWLVAADGAHSKVRQLSKLRMEGDSFEGRFVIADIKIDIDLPTERLAFFDPSWNPGNTVLMHREPGNIWRIDYQLAKHEDPVTALKPEVLYSRIQAQLDMIGVSNSWQLDWCSVYSARAMTLPSYRHQRILFAGDSAHMLPIFGVRGANTGWQDGHNLSWKLAALVQGWGSENLLNSYSTERVESAREIIQEASKSTRFMTPPTKGYQLLRDATLSLSLRHTFVQPLFHWRTSRAHNYLNWPLNTLEPLAQNQEDGLIPGYPIRNVKLSCKDYLFDKLGPAFYLFCFSSNGAIDEGLIAAKACIEKRSIPFEIVLISTVKADVEQVVNIHDPLNNSGDIYQSALYPFYLVRPDQHICARWQQLSSQQLVSALDKALSA